VPSTEPFEKNLKKYEDWFEKYRYAYLSEVETVRQFIPPNKKGIEIGIGTGRFALPFGIKDGVEPAKSMQKYSRKLGVEVHNGVAENLPLANRSFDFALMVTTICFVDDILQSFKEINRVLVPNGRFIIGMIDKDSSLGAAYESMKNQNEFYRMATFYSVDEVIGYLKETEFGDFQIIQTVFGDPESMNEIQPFQTGYGQGGFVVIKANKLYELYSYLRKSQR
jgi:ubiquinone/menaquinone biosynthesis C-methylase UbiE